MSWCDCSDYGGSIPDFYSVVIRTARKPHRCCECDTEIKPGERHEYATGKWDGEIDTFRTCLMCVSIRQHFCPQGSLHQGLDEALIGTINTSLKTIRGFWLIDEKDRRIASLVELCCELLEGDRQAERKENQPNE